MPVRPYLVAVILTLCWLNLNRAAIPASLPRVFEGRTELSFKSYEDQGRTQLLLDLKQHPKNLRFSYEQVDLDSIRYQLGNFDVDTLSTPYPLIRYTNIPGGIYEFRADGWCQGQRIFHSQFKLAVTPTLLESGVVGIIGLFLFVIVVAVVLVISFANKHNRQRIQGFQVRIAKDLHDQVGSSLVSIRYTTKSLIGRTSHPEALQMLREVDLLCAESVESLREAIWAVDPQHSTMEQQWGRMVDFASRLLHDADIQLVVVDQEPGARQILHLVLHHPEQRRNIYLMFREIITNIVKHSQAQKVEIALTPNAEGLELRISDDGIGFDPLAVELGHHGVENIRERGIDNFIQVDLQTAPGAGTTWRLILPQL